MSANSRTVGASRRAASPRGSGHCENAAAVAAGAVGAQPGHELATIRRVPQTADRPIGWVGLLVPSEKTQEQFNLPSEMGADGFILFPEDLDEMLHGPLIFPIEVPDIHPRPRRFPILLRPPGLEVLVGVVDEPRLIHAEHPADLAQRRGSGASQEVGVALPVHSETLGELVLRQPERFADMAEFARKNPGLIFWA